MTGMKSKDHKNVGEEVFLELDAEQVAKYLQRMIKYKKDAPKLYLSVKKSCEVCKHLGDDPRTSGEYFDPYCYKHGREPSLRDENIGYCDDFELSRSNVD